ncbi:intercellular adhesion molecule 2-like isoform X1 [Ovis aries]|uniref:intercellular adhesion molecule 2-like isoform X1 n=2 Tax=Ovis aries TaxID=9940 RepID=UPI001C2E3009|nr:intercellular adhesion molecule 2-like isoform X1 [Ovis aries]
MIQQGPLKLLFSFLDPKDSFRRGCKGLSPASEISSSPGNNGCWKLDLGHPLSPSRQHPFADTGSPQLFPVSLQTLPEMSPFGGCGTLAAFLALLCCRGSGVKAFVEPELLMVESGESQLFNCTASCTDPEKLVLETELNNILLESQAQWKLFQVDNISKDVELLCSFTCGGRQETKVFNITVFYPPKQVLLTLWPTSVAAGTLFTIECRVPAVAPLEGLTVTLLRGTEILYIQTFVGTAPSPQDAVVSHNTTAHREDGHHNFLCEAQMDLRSRGGGLVHRVSDPQRLEVKEPEPNTPMVALITTVTVLLLVVVTLVLLCQYRWWTAFHTWYWWYNH